VCDLLVWTGCLEGEPHEYLRVERGWADDFEDGRDWSDGDVDG
jgi:hypothetical protein